MVKQYLETGRIVGTHGVRGEMRVEPWSDSPESLCRLKALYLDGGKKKLDIVSIRPHKSMILLKVRGVDSMEAAQAMRGTVLFLNRDDVQLEEGRHFVQDLIGLKVLDADSGKQYGELTDVSRTGANDVYHLRSADGKETLIPAIPDVVICIDLEEGVMEIRPLRGLFDED